MIDQAKADEIYQMGKIAGQLQRDEEIKAQREQNALLLRNLDWARAENESLCAEIERLKAELEPLRMGTLRKWWDARSTWRR